MYGMVLPTSVIYTGVLLWICNFSDGQTREIPTSCGRLPTVNSSIICAMCENNLYSWFDDEFHYNSSNYDWTRELPFESNIASWESICRWGGDVATAIGSILQSCPSSVGEEILKSPDSYWLLNNSPSSICGSCGDDPYQSLHSWNRILNFYRRSCEKGRLKPSTKQLLTDPMLDSSLQCMNAKVRRNVRRCLGILSSEYQFGISKLHWTEPGDEDDVTQLASSILTCMFSVINQSPCNQATKKVLYQVMRVQLPANVDDGKLTSSESTTEDFRSKLRCTVGVYGDPHLKTCWSESLVTCSSPGLNMYFSNRYLIISGNNQVIGKDTSPRGTVLKSISITFQSIDGDLIVGTYSASNGQLPAVFNYPGGTSSGTGYDAVEIHSDSSQGIRFVQKGTGAVLILRQWNGYYFFTLRMAENVMVASEGLLIDGCPPDQIVTLGSVINRAKRSASQSDCVLGCTQMYGSLEEYIRTCTIDCLITGDLDLATNMTTGAILNENLVLNYDDALIKDAFQTGSKSGSKLIYINNMLVINLIVFACFLI